MKTVLLLGGPAAGQRVETKCGNIQLIAEGVGLVTYRVVPMCSHGEVHWFGVLDGADPLVLLIAGYGMNVAPAAERYTGRHPGLDMPYGTSHAEAMNDFSPTKNREGEAP